jgi:hypothetical protein
LMAKWRKILASVLYALALLISVAGTTWIISLHLSVWMRGKFFLGSMSGPVILEYVIVSALIWVIARLLDRRSKWDRAFYIVTGIPLLMMFVIPGRFGLGDL